MPRRARAKRDPLIDSLSATTSAGPIKRFSPMNQPLRLPGGATVDPRTMGLNPELDNRYEGEDPFADDPRQGPPGFYPNEMPRPRGPGDHDLLDEFIRRSQPGPAKRVHRDLDPEDPGLYPGGGLFGGGGGPPTGWTPPTQAEVERARWQPGDPDFMGSSTGGRPPRGR